MNIKELDSFKLSDAVQFHDNLNPKLFAGRRLKPSVRVQLLRIADDFITYMGLKKLDVVDITLTGSNAAYSYTDHSDLDLHIIVDFSKLNPDDVYQELFLAKKNLYNDKHDIKIHDYDVEVYVQDKNEPHISLGQYSVMSDKWLHLPRKRRASIDQNVVRAKSEKLQHIISRAADSNNTAIIDAILKKLQKYRKAGLAKGGEFSPENLAYKIIRNRGILEKLYKIRDQYHSRDLSLPD